MQSVNRAMMVVRARQPYVDWADSIGDDGERISLAEHRADPTAYLIPRVETAEDAEDLLMACWPLLFESELEAWCTDEEYWPARRTIEMFAEWFEVELHSMVIDITAEPFEGEEM